MADAVPAQPQAAPPESLPEPEQPSVSEMDADATVQSAIRFLQDARVRRSPIESQIRFLKGKGVSDGQIRHAFAKVGRAVTAEKIASVRVSSANAAPPAATAAAGATTLSAQLKTARQEAPVSIAPGPQYTQTLFPYLPPPPQVERQAKTVDWRDVVIGAGAAMLAGFSGYTIFNRYSPYEFRRKSEKKPRLHHSSYSRYPPASNASSESETDASSMRLRGRVPPLPAPPPVASTAEPIVSATSPTNLTEEVKKLQMELEEIKEALTNERKKCADLAVSAAKIRADKQQLSRANDRLTQQIDGLKKDIEKLEAEKGAAAGEATQAAAEGAAAAAPAPASTCVPSVAAEGEQTRTSPAVTPESNATAPNADTATILPIVPSPEDAALVAADAAISEPITEAASAAPTSMAAVTSAPELSTATVAAPAASADAVFPAATVTEAVASYLPTSSTQSRTTKDDTPVCMS
ncbi:hypothetical protein GH5_05899 [Leishmania sp. Ghana 2012 LV757]|uniref:hypothetical protein n=1 Tax=Leishmania sp. Ghana 2012 LV757 TaxID=2803181 RepID=UPI001B519FF0|nr:hypothetical protein GH5_05899 [Leishmania sp. Ghana 2012 LV757]